MSSTRTNTAASQTLLIVVLPLNHAVSGVIVVVVIAIFYHVSLH